MTRITAPTVKPLPMANGCLISLPAIFSTKISSPYLSLPSKPIKIHLCYSSFSLPSSLSLKERTHSSTTVAFVAQTSDWAQLGEDDTVVVEEEEESWGSQEVDGGMVEAVGNAGAGESGREEGFVEGEGLYTAPPEEAKLYVGNVPFDVDSEALAQLFEQVGVVEMAEVVYNRETDQSRGFGFVSMSTVEETEKAEEVFNGYDLNGRFLVVNKAAPRGSRKELPPRAFEPAFRAYVGNLPWDVEDQQLERLFIEHGKVVQARVVYDRESGRSRGFGFVTMASEEELNDAVSKLDGQSLGGRAIRVNVAEDRPRRSF